MIIQDKKTNKFFCEGCVFGKQQRNTYPTLTEKERDTTPGTYVHIDLCGPMSTASIGGALYFMLCKDNNTGYMVIFFLKKKSDALIYLKQLVSLMKQELQIDIQRIKTNQGGEFKNHQFQAYTQDKGIIHEFSAAYTSEQNGFIEHSNRTIVEAARSMLHSRGLPLNLWAEAANTAVFVWNRTVNKQFSDTTPFERLFQHVLDVSYFRAFGSAAYLHIPKKHRTKLEAKSQKFVLVGYDQNGRAYRLWNPSTKRIHVGVDVIIHETLGLHIGDVQTQQIDPCTNNIVVPIFSTPVAPVASTSIANIPTSSDRPNVSMPLLSEGSNHTQGNNIFHDTVQKDETYSEATSAPVYKPYTPAGFLHDEVETAQFQGEIEGTMMQGENETTPTQGEMDTLSLQGGNADVNLPGDLAQFQIHSPSSQSTRNSNRNIDGNRDDEAINSDEDGLGSRIKPRSRHPPLRYGDWIMYDDNRSNAESAAYIANKSERIPEPKTFKKAMTSSHAQQWKQVMTKKFASLLENKTWVLKPLPEG